MRWRRWFRRTCHASRSIRISSTPRFWPRTRTTPSYIQTSSAALNEDDKTARLTMALTAAQLGKELAKKATSNQKRPATTYLERIAPDDALATLQALQTNAKYLARLKGE